MTLLLNLYLGHLLGDFVLQPGRLVVAKRNGIAGLALHVAIIGVVTAAILYSQLATYWNIVLLAMAAHMSIEVITIKARDSRRLSGLSVFLIDQMMHVLSLVTLVWIAAPAMGEADVMTLGRVADPIWIALACALIGVSFMGSIITFELSNSVGPETWNQEILPFDRSRTLGMVERSLALLLAVLLHPALVVAPFIPRVLLAVRKNEEERARQMLVATAGLVIAVAGWGLVVFVAFYMHGGRL